VSDWHVVFSAEVKNYPNPMNLPYRMILDEIATERMMILTGWVFAFIPYMFDEDSKTNQSKRA
jgi:hypothetical protein